jgi:hypothetical protein
MMMDTGPEGDLFGSHRKFGGEVGVEDTPVRAISDVGATRGIAAWSVTTTVIPSLVSP